MLPTLRILPLFALTLLLAACGGYTTRVIDTPETRDLKGWQKPYTVNGVRYDPLRSSAGFVEEGVASWYGPDFHGKLTSNGEVYDMHAMTAAHKTLPLGVYLRVTRRDSGRETIVRVNDRGPFVQGRVIDLSYAAAKALDVVGPGTAPVRLEALGYRVTDSSGAVRYEPPPSYEIGSYAVQVGAFGAAENAERLAARMQARYGVAEVCLGEVGGRLFHRVRVGRYGTLEAAEAARAQLEAAGHAGGFVVAVE